MQARLEEMQLCVSPASFDQVVMRAILDQTTAFDGDYAICDSKRRESMRDDNHRPPCDISDIFCCTMRSLS